MPEGDVVWYTARRLHEALAGRVLTRSDFRAPRLATADLAGDVVTETVAHGKHLLTRTKSGLTVHTHLKMDGSWRIRPATARQPPDQAAPGQRGLAGHRVPARRGRADPDQRGVTCHRASGPRPARPGLWPRRGGAAAERTARPAYRRGPAGPAERGRDRQSICYRNAVPSGR